LVQGTNGARRELQNSRRRPQTQLLLGQLGHRGRDFAGFALSAYRRDFHPPLDAIAKRPNGIFRATELLRFTKHRQGQRDLQIVQAALSQLLPRGLLDVIRLNLAQDLGVHVQRFAFTELLEPAGKALILVPASQIVVHTSQGQTVPQVGPFGIVPNGLFVMGERFAPPLLGLQGLPALNHLGDRGLRRQGFGRNHDLGSDAARHEPQADYGGEEQAKGSGPWPTGCALWTVPSLHCHVAIQGGGRAAARRARTTLEVVKRCGSHGG
jgi:hypothetical protein